MGSTTSLRALSAPPAARVVPKTQVTAPQRLLAAVQPALVTASQWLLAAQPAPSPKVGTDAVGPKTSTSASVSKAGATGPRQRLTQALARGATLTRAAQEAGVSPQLAAVMVEQLRRSGSLLGATSLCASGLGACHSLDVDENTAIRCAGCPLSLKRTI